MAPGNPERTTAATGAALTALGGTSSRRRNFGSETASVTSSNTTATGIPIAIASGRQSTKLLTNNGPSSSRTSTVANGVRPWSAEWTACHDTTKLYTTPRPLTGAQSCSIAPQPGHIGCGG